MDDQFQMTVILLLLLILWLFYLFNYTTWMEEWYDFVIILCDKYN